MDPHQTLQEKSSSKLKDNKKYPKISDIDAYVGNSLINKPV
jgi:hypothetical protein